MKETDMIFVGIDISKATLDICVLDGGQNGHFTIDNGKRAITAFFKRLADRPLAVCMENTGRYGWCLLDTLQPFGFALYVVNPLHLKRSLGLARGKNDKVDAERIAKFIERHHGDLEEWDMPSQAARQLGVLMAERSRRIKVKRQMLNVSKDYALMADLPETKQLQGMNKRMIAQLDRQIAQLEERIGRLVGADERLSRVNSLIRTVPGVGKVLSWSLMAKTNGFTKIDDPRKMACYAGVVPFDHQSGTSLRYRPRVSFYADKGLKSTLHLAAMSAIRLDNDLRQYYLRKVAEGKNKMSVLNAVRNKIIHRVYAVIKKQKPYENHLVLS